MFTLTTTLSLIDYDIINLIITDENKTLIEDIGADGVCLFIKQFLSEQAHFEIPVNNNNLLQLNTIEYLPNAMHGKYNEKMPGTLQFQIFDSDCDLPTTYRVVASKSLSTLFKNLLNIFEFSDL